MRYKVIIRKCQDPQRAASIAREIAKWSGTNVDTVYNAITRKPVCIRKKCEQQEARLLHKRFSAVGAEVDLFRVDNFIGNVPFTSPVNTTVNSETDAKTGHCVNGTDDEDGEPGRILTDSEYVHKLKERSDIFYLDNNRRLSVMEVTALLLAIGIGMWLSTQKIITVPSDFLENITNERIVTLITEKEVIASLIEKKEKVIEKKERVSTDKKPLTPKKRSGNGGNSGGGGDPRAHATKQGVLGIISGQVIGKTVASADIFAKGGFADNIDAILGGVNGLKSNGSAGVGRKGVQGIGYGPGYESGFPGNGPGGIGDIINGLFSSEGDTKLELNPRKGQLTITAPEFVKNAAFTGGRSKSSIMRVVMQNIAALRYAYNQRLREKPGLNGRITVKWAIDEFGKVLHCEVMGSTINDPQLEKTVVHRIKRWAFEKIDKPGDITEIIYPFVFSQ